MGKGNHIPAPPPNRPLSGLIVQPERVLLRDVAPLWHRFLNMPRPQPYKNSYWLAEAGVNPLRGSLPSSLLPYPPLFFLPSSVCLSILPSLSDHSVDIKDRLGCSYHPEKISKPLFTVVHQQQCPEQKYAVSNHSP